MNVHRYNKEQEKKESTFNGPKRLCSVQNIAERKRRRILWKERPKRHKSSVEERSTAKETSSSTNGTGLEKRKKISPSMT